MTLALVLVAAVVLVAVITLAMLVYLGTVTGALTLDTGWGRRTRPLGPLTADIAAPRATVYALLVQPYVGRPTKALAEKVQILERGEGVVLAAHRTPIRGRLVAVTVETVTFTPTEQIGFRLVRGPVPHVTETFTLTDTETGTGCRLDYRGELGTDFGPAGAWWGRQVARRWEDTVNATMRAVRTEAERQAAHQSRRP
jgi:hypothetical protein